MAGQNEACRGCATADVLKARIAELETALGAVEETALRVLRELYRDELTDQQMKLAACEIARASKR